MQIIQNRKKKETQNFSLKLNICRVRTTNYMDCTCYIKWLCIFSKEKLFGVFFSFKKKNLVGLLLSYFQHHPTNILTQKKCSNNDEKMKHYDIRHTL